ncbi:unnamed protein product, partial [marine sediment metagenome]
DMEKAAAGAARLREEFMTRYSAKQSYMEECKECSPRFIQSCYFQISAANPGTNADENTQDSSPPWNL